MPSFHQASNFTIEQLNQNEVHVNLEQQKRKGEIVEGAAHDAGERFDAPKCHPDTRRAVLDNIKTWVKSDDASTKLMWLNGPAGAGKSAIAQTTAEDCCREGTLVASFFFSRFAAGRNTKTGLVATIAYQLSVSIPEVREHIVNNIVKNPKIFKANIKTQFQTLVVEPYSLLEHADGSITRPRLVIVDGLDECENDDHQAEIIHAFAISLSTHQTSHMRVLLASRPESKIRRTINEEAITSICTQLALDKEYNPDEDIELFLRSSFQVLKRHHVLAPMIHKWPPRGAIKEIVQKSSGQFIYAATVMKYISDPQQSPMKRLEIVLNITPAGDEWPFAHLDALYTTILTSIGRDYRKIALIFEAIMFLIIGDFNIRFPPQWKILAIPYTDEFLSFENELPLYLADLSSIVNVKDMERYGIRFYHASLDDYLQDPSRSQRFYIDKHQSHARIARYCINHITGPPGVSDVVYMYSLDLWANHYQLSDWDDTVLECLHTKNMLAPGTANAHIGLRIKEMLFKINVSYDRRNDMVSMLGRILELSYREKLKGSLQNAIDAEFLHHMHQCEPHYIVIIYFMVKWLKVSDWTTITAVLPALKHISQENILFDIHIKSVRIWFKYLIQNTGYLDHLSKDTYIWSTSAILEIVLGSELPWRSAMDGLRQPSSTTMATYIYQLASELFEHLPTSNELSHAIFRKWELLKHDPLNVAYTDQPYTVETYDDGSDYGECSPDEFRQLRIRLIDGIIESYRTRSLQQDVSCKEVQTEVHENLTTAVDSSLAKHQNNTTISHSTYSIKLLIMLVLAQAVVIGYMYLRLNGT